MATLVASGAKSDVMPRAIHAGLQMAISTYSLTATLSTGDVIQFLKLPDGANVVGGFWISPVKPLSVNSATATMKIGTAADDDGFGIVDIDTATSIDLVQAGGALFGSNITVSDSAATRYTMVVGTAVNAETGATGTKSGAITLCLLYQINTT